MGSIEDTIDPLRREARIGYELARLRRALWGSVPVVLIVIVAALLGRHPSSTLAVGLVAAMASVAMLSWGRDPQKAVLPGVAAGLLPLGFALVASRVHLCGAHGCTSLCVPACAVGGLLAGFVIAIVGHHKRAGVWFWPSASGLALLTGSLGCACVGSSGVVGLGIGFVVGVTPGLIRRVFASQSR